ncbi:MAG: transcriptional repressor [Clostridia bacterium]|nr:transcriptional repressor [Clostridia bacterium]MBQ2237418.1 transcriptional repressor [Clostridia bacterium]MEE1185116.1 transcriptional repressor [Acutalibacteraceae bacterium]
MKNYSRQREAIMNVLHSTDMHPTASQVYKRVRQIIPNISLGTVYRNLSALSEAGEILTISVGEGCDHFDGNAKPHLHLHCRNCGNIADVEFDFKSVENKIADLSFAPETSVLVIHGVCKNCNK